MKLPPSKGKIFSETRGVGLSTKKNGEEVGEGKSAEMGISKAVTRILSLADADGLIKPDGFEKTDPAKLGLAVTDSERNGTGDGEVERNPK